MTDTPVITNSPSPTPLTANQGQSNTPSTLEYGRVFKLTIGKPGAPGTPASSTISINGVTKQINPDGTLTLTASEFSALPSSDFTPAPNTDGTTGGGTVSNSGTISPSFASGAKFNADGTITLTGVQGTVAPATGPTQGQAIDLSNLRCVFTVTKGSTSSPNVCLVRVYNLSKATSRLIQREYTQVVLQAGYVGNVGTIFNGTVIHMTRGKNMNVDAAQAQPSILSQRENQTDTYLEIVAADGDLAHNFATIHVSLAAGATLQNKLDAISAALKPLGYTIATPPTFTQGTAVLPRGQVLHGQFRDIMDGFCAGTGSTWSIQDGVVEIILKDSVMPGTAIVLSPTTGLLNMPRETINGVEMTCLLNPALKAGRVVELKAPVNQVQPGTGFTAQDIVNPLDPQGLYRVFYFQHTGDTRGNPWYTNIIALGLTDQGPNPGSSSLNYYGV